MAEKYSLVAIWDYIDKVRSPVMNKVEAERTIGDLIDIVPIGEFETNIVSVAGLLLWQLFALGIMYVFVVYVAMWLPRVGSFKPVRYIAGDAVAEFSSSPISWLPMLMMMFVLMPIYTTFVMPVALASPAMQMLLTAIGPDAFYSMCGYITTIGYLPYEIIF